MPDETATRVSGGGVGAADPGGREAPGGGPTEVDAELALARLDTWSSALRGACVLDGEGEILAATGERERWVEAARGLLAAADAAAGEPVTQAHIGTEDGEVFAVRERGYALVAATDRFALASLTLFDIRSALRELAGAGGAAIEPGGASPAR